VLQRVDSWNFTNKESLRCHTNRRTLSSIVSHSADPVQGSTASATPSCRSVSTYTVILLESERSHRKALGGLVLHITARLQPSHVFRIRQFHSISTMPKCCPSSSMLTNWNNLELSEKTMRTLARTLQPSKVVATSRSFATTYSPSQHISDNDQTPYWRNLRPWKDVHADDFLNYGWQVGSFDTSSSWTRLTLDIRKRIRSNGQTSS
jgi:hypothetical protein